MILEDIQRSLIEATWRISIEMYYLLYPLLYSNQFNYIGCNAEYRYYLEYDERKTSLNLARITHELFQTFINENRDLILHKWDDSRVQSTFYIWADQIGTLQLSQPRQGVMYLKDIFTMAHETFHLFDDEDMLAIAKQYCPALRYVFGHELSNEMTIFL